MPADITVGGHRPSPPGNRPLVAALAITQTIGYGALCYAFAVFLVPIAADLHTSTTAVTGAFTASVLTSAVLAVPVGRWLDQRGGRALMTFGSLLGTVLLLVWSQTDQLWQLYAVQIGIGAASAVSLYEAAFAVIIAWHQPQQRSAALLALTVVAVVLGERPRGGIRLAQGRSSLQHAYGPAVDVPEILDGLRSANAEERNRALRDYWSRLHHQGSIYPATAASMPFLFELAADPAAQDRAEVVTLLASITEKAFGDVDWTGSAEVARSRAGHFVTLAGDPEAHVRIAAIPALPLVLDDAERTATLLTNRLLAATGSIERMTIVAAMGTLAVREPQCAPDMTALLGSLAVAPAVHLETRLAAVVHRARSLRPEIDDNVVPAAIDLLHRIGEEPTEQKPTCHRSAVAVHEPADSSQLQCGLPRRTWSMPSTVTGCGSAGNTLLACAVNASATTGHETL
jgi:hypothetical protein